MDNSDIEYAFWWANRTANDQAIIAFTCGIDPTPPSLRKWLKHVLGHLAASLQAPRQRRSADHGLEALRTRSVVQDANPFGCPSQSQ
jgi:hypothetical protein